MARYYHSYPRHYKKRPNYANLFNDNGIKAKMLYNKDMAFRRFVIEWNADEPELMGWTLTDFYMAYKNGKSVQLKLALA